MNRQQVFPAVSMIFLLFALIAGLAQFITDWSSFGWSYQVTTVILGVETVKTVNVTYELVGCFFFLWFLAISFQNYRLIGQKLIKEKD